MEFLFVFLVSFVVLLIVALALVFGRSPTYRPSRASVLALLQRVVERQARIEEWELFLSLPVNHDPDLEAIRQQCLIITHGDDSCAPAGEGLNGAIFDHRGMLRLLEVIKRLRQLIEAEPASKLF